MKKKEFLAGVLTLALLAGCGAKGPTGDLVSSPDDIAFQTTDIQRDRELVTVDGQPITAERYLFWLSNAIQSAKQYGEITDDASWDAPLEGEKTLSEVLKADALETAKLYRVVETKAEEYGVTLSAEQEKEMEDQLAQAKESVGGEENFQWQLDSMAISAEGFSKMNRVVYLHQGLMEKLKEKGELTVTQADKDRFVEEFFPADQVYGAKHILLATRKAKDDGSYEEMTDEEKAAVKAKAEELRQQLRDAGDSGELFDELMNQFSEDGRDSEGNLYYPDGYGMVYGGQMVPEFEAGALALKVGEIGEPVATDYGYHIIQRIPVDQAQIDSIVEANCTEEYKFQEVLEEWIDQAKVTTTEAYDQLSPKDFSQRLEVIIQAREAAAAAAATAEPAEPTESAEAQK